MKILLITAYFPPELGSAANLFFQLGGEFVRRGHSVTVLTGFPSYNVEADNLSELYRTSDHLVEEVDGMTVIRTRTVGLPRQIPVLRGIGQLAMMWSFGRAGLRSALQPDAILVYSPPLFLGLTALALRRRTRASVVVNIQDLFPQSAIDLGVLKNRLFIRIFRRIERTIYGAANAITVHSSGNRAHVLRNGGHEDRTFEVPNLVDTARLRPGERLNAFRQRHAIDQDTILVSFAGVIGLSQDLDIVLGAARLLCDLPHLLFLIVGDGLEKPRLMKAAEGMRNVRFLPMLQPPEYAELLHASDVCLATLRKDVRTPVVPSKILSIMAAGRPVLASMPLEGDAPRLVRDAQCGVVVPPEDAASFANALREMLRSPGDCAAFGTNGRQYVEAHCSLQATGSLYEQLFEQLTRQNSKGSKS